MGFEDILSSADLDTGSTKRPSVFDRLTIDPRLEHKPVVKSNMNFAAAVGKESTNTLNFFPLENKVRSSIRLPIELAKEVMKTHHTALVGYFLGPRVHFLVVLNYVKTVWNKYGFVDAMMNDNGVYFFKFNDVGGCTQVIESGPLMIRGAPLFVSLWDPVKGISKPVHDTCPLWIKLHNVPLVAFNREGIGRIASALGISKQMDACTASMCDKAWGRPGFAKVLVDVWAVGELKKELEVIIPNVNGGDDVTVKIRVEYVWEPLQCSHCLVFGHKISSCVKALMIQKNKQKAKDKEDDGFVTVKRKEWRAKRMDQATTSGIDKSKEEEPAVVVVDNVFGILTDQEVEEPVMEPVLESTTVDKPVVEPVLEPNRVVEQDEESVLEEDTNVMRTESVSKPTQGRTIDPQKQDIPTVHIGVSSGELPIHTPIIEQVTRNFNPNSKPVRGILKNTNRGNVLGQEDSRLRDIGAKQVPKKGDQELCCCWNIRGLNTRIKQGEVKTVIRESGVSFCAIVESHVKPDMLGSICGYVFGQWKWISNAADSPSGTRIILAWDDSVGDVMVLQTNHQFIHCLVKLRGGQDSFFLTIVYGSNSYLERKLLWSGLRKAKVLMGSQPWTIMGDFNSMFFPHDGYGGSSKRNSSMEDFYACIEDIEVLDVSYTGIHYTWTQKPRGGDGLLRKLDRIMANTEFLGRFDGSLVSFNPRGLSDHAFGVLDIKVLKRKKNRGFKFDNHITEHDDFLEVVAMEWSYPVYGSFMHKLLAHLKRLKQPLRKLQNRFGDVSNRVSILRKELDAIQVACDNNPSDSLLLEDLASVVLAYERARLDEEAFYKQRAKIRWLKEGDSNTKFFHNAIKETRCRNHIRTIIDVNGNCVHDDDVGMVFVDHFKNFLGTQERVEIQGIQMDLLTTTLSLADSLHMIRPILDVEIKCALFSIGNDKARGSDGFSAKFFKSAWSVIGNDFLVAIHNFFYSGRLTKEINHTLLCLIPKVPNATRVGDFRPISCCSVLYKVISKVIAERLKPFLAKIIGPTQSAFIPGRRITDNIMMAHELVVGYQRSQGQPRCAFKIDLRKAYDTVDWRFLIGMLQGFGFHPVFCKWINEMLSTSSFSIAINGETHGFFKGAKGLRQGDPISPYLFTIVMEGFSMLLKKCIVEASDFQYHQGCEELQITHLCFADDLFVFTRGDLASVEVLKRALDLFRSASGLEPNLSKSEVFFCNVSQGDRTAILTSIPLRTGLFPIRYLGVPLSPVCLRVADFAPLINKVKARIHDWKSKFLSFGGRKQLVISVLQSMQLYWMMVYVIPSGVIHELEGMFRKFLWAQGDSSKGKCKIAWDAVCKPIQCGGLGFRRLTVWNHAIITKHIWDILIRRNSLWVAWTCFFLDYPC
ncbi:hypothetical protein OSB04_un000297 [Centaurea solstitialis]|uniref:Reverse transcriptase domain-containing protein n=1 Tax=Centaurea solstitialis TaxID=347529 RepID=A0AA38SI14_9ASTR|nr:hypothetical protein OSB04_un000297 [Centaurea solstitialis]